MTQEEISEMLKKPARIKQIETTDGTIYETGSKFDIVLLQNHNAIVVQLAATSNKPLFYTVIAAHAVAAVTMEIEGVRPDAE